MKITQTINVTRDELTAAKGTYADALGMFIKKAGAPDEIYNNSMKTIFGHDVKIDVNARSVIGAFKYKFHMTDEVELDVTIEVKKEAFIKIMSLSYNIFELALPVLAAAYEMGSAKEKIQNIKRINAELNNMAGVGHVVVDCERLVK